MDRKMERSWEELGEGKNIFKVCYTKETLV